MFVRSVDGSGYLIFNHASPPLPRDAPLGKYAANAAPGVGQPAALYPQGPVGQLSGCLQLLAAR